MGKSKGRSLRDARDLEHIARLLFLAKYSSETEPMPMADSVRRPDTYFVATVSRDIRNQFDFSNGLMLRRPDYDVVADREAMIAKINKLLDIRDQKHDNAGAIICFGEMDYPIAPNENENKAADRSFRVKLQSIATNRNCLIVAGSYHSKRRFNKAVVCAPGFEKAVTHAKRKSAHKSRENIVPPPNHFVRVYTTQIAKVAILICADIYDLNTLFHIARENSIKRDQGGPVDIVLVPSYNRNNSEFADEACRRFSFISNTVVVYVNCMSNQPFNAIYNSGQPLIEKYENRKLLIGEGLVDAGCSSRFEIISEEDMGRQARDTHADYSPLLREILEGRGRSIPLRSSRSAGSAGKRK